MERQLESPSPDGRAARDSRDSGPRGYTESPDAYVQPRQESSRSPGRNEHYGKPQERGSQRQRQMYDDGEIHDVHDDYDGGPRGRDDARRRSRHMSPVARGYDGMYDDDRYGPEERYHPHRYDRRSYSRGYRDDECRARSPATRGHYARSRSYSPRRDAGRPSDTVIIEGLPQSMTADELRESLLSGSVAADLPSFDIRFSTSRETRRAFLQFSEVDDAVTFVKEHFPKLVIEMRRSTDEVPSGNFEAYLHYARSRGGPTDGEPRNFKGTNWICLTCDFSNFATRNKCKVCGGPPPAAVPQQDLTGVTDASEAPSQILVVYPLASFVTEDMLANEMKRLELDQPDRRKERTDGAPKLKSTAPSNNPAGYGARPGSLHRVFLMRSSKSDESLKYGFVEFWTVEDASAALAKFKMARNFTVSGYAITVSSTHMGVFTAEEREVTPANEYMSFYPLFNSNVRVRYRDLRAYPSQRIVAPQPPGAGPANTGEDVGEKKKPKKRKADGPLADSSGKKSVAMAGQMALWQQRSGELRNADDAVSADTNDQAERSKPAGVVTNASKLETKGGPIKISLSKSASFNTLAAPGEEIPAQEKSQADGRATRASEPDNTDQLEATFVDRDRLMCLICMRKYKSVDEVTIHEKSRNHKNSMENDELVQAALTRISTMRSKKQNKSGGTKQDASEPAAPYRDRAKERREAFSQPKKPGNATAGGGSVVSKAVEDKAAAAKPVPSKGAGMLAKMGWTVGAGLGAKEDGRTEAVAANAYQEGVGLGAEDSNMGDAAQLAERSTTNKYSDYVKAMQDKTRARFKKLG